MKIILSLIFVILLCSCISPTKPSSNNSKYVNFLIQTDNSSPFTYGDETSTWRITTDLIKEKEVPKTYFYNFTIQALHKEFSIKNIKYKYGEYGKWRTHKKEKFARENELNEHSKKQTLRMVPITIKKTGVAHKQIFQINVESKNNEQESLVLVFGVNKCIAKQENETLCF